MGLTNTTTPFDVEPSLQAAASPIAAAAPIRTDSRTQWPARSLPRARPPTGPFARARGSQADGPGQIPFAATGCTPQCSRQKCSTLGPAAPQTLQAVLQAVAP